MTSIKLIVKKRKAQMNFFAKLLFIVATSVVFVLVLMYINSFRKSTAEEKQASDFKMEAMDVLQKIVTDKECLAYQNNDSSQKIVLDLKKIDALVTNYKDIEPDCAKTLGFDYNIMIVQFGKKFSVYPGEVEVAKKRSVSREFLTHSGEEGAWCKCNFYPDEEPELCTKWSECDTWAIPECPSSCGDEPAENCPHKTENDVCCVHHGSTHCECKEEWVTKYLQSIPFTTFTIPKEIWSFGVGVGVEAFSPEKAKKGELQLSIPVTIRHNSTFSAEGMIYFYAVKGELEDLYGLIEDLCKKAEDNPNNEISISRETHLSLPVYYSNNKLCMLEACKKIVCPYRIQFENVTAEGDYIMRFSYNPSNGLIEVNK